MPAQGTPKHLKIAHERLGRMLRRTIFRMHDPTNTHNQYDIYRHQYARIRTLLARVHTQIQIAKEERLLARAARIPTPKRVRHPITNRYVVINPQR